MSDERGDPLVGAPGLVPVGHDPYNEGPLDAVPRQAQFIDELRQRHLARAGGLPLLGVTQPVAPPPHIQSHDDMTGLVNRYADLAQQGIAAKDWYLRSGHAIASATGDHETADKFASALAGTSTGTDVASNTMHAITLHNQAMAGDPLAAGRFPAQMGERVARSYYGGEPLQGEKIGPFMGATVAEWNPDFAHTFVNDIHNMRAAEYTGSPAQQTVGGLYTGSPTQGQHNFKRILGDMATDEMQRRTGQDWEPRQVQAAAWAAIKSRNEGAPIEQTARDFADGLQRSYGQASWESAPGMTSGNLPEFHDAPQAVRQAYHQAIRSVLVDDQGRDVIARHLGLLTGPSFDAPGVYLGHVNPGTQSQIALGQAPGGWKAGVDPASKALMDTAEATRGLLLRQDAAAWHKPAYAKGMSMRDANLADIRFGRPLNLDEAEDVTRRMAERTGGDFFSPIPTTGGYRFLNVPDATGLSNKDFQGAVRDVVAEALHPEAEIVHAKSDGNYIPNDWRENLSGEDYLRAISGTGRPDLQRASAELLATLGPRIAAIEEDFAREHGWTPNRATRLWETSPVIGQYAGAVIPSPPHPWRQANAPPNPNIATPPGPAPQGVRPFVMPVDHDPFAPGPFAPGPFAPGLVAPGVR